MNILALCDARYEDVTRLLWEKHATDGMVLASPPSTEPVERGLFTGRDVIYLDLHGERGDDYLHGDGTQALSIHSVRRMNLSGAVVFATVCYLPETLFVSAFLEAGARAVIGGHGENWGNRRTFTGAQKLADLWLEAYVRLGYCAPAFTEAWSRLADDWHQKICHHKAWRDALQFQIWRGHEVQNRLRLQERRVHG